MKLSRFGLNFRSFNAEVIEVELKLPRRFMKFRVVQEFRGIKTLWFYKASEEKIAIATLNREGSMCNQAMYYEEDGEQITAFTTGALVFNACSAAANRWVMEQEKAPQT